MSGISSQQTIIVGRGAGKYPIQLTPDIDTLINQTAALTSDAQTCVIVVDATVHALYPRLVKKLHTTLGKKRTTILTIPSGEKYKNSAQLLKLVDCAIASGADRSSMILALGGGVTTDLAGCAASLILRGIRWIAIPTTFLGMIDAAIGGKTGVNTKQGKNLLGTFWAPIAVLIWPEFIRTQARTEFADGQAEAVKYYSLRRRPALKSLETLLEDFPKHETTTAERVIRQCVAIKAQIVTADERERGQRAFLNFGHTIGHALEYCDGYRRLSHGRAVAAGMVGALYLSRNNGLQSVSATERLELFCRRLAAGRPIDVETNQALEALAYDKKRRAGKLMFVLLHEIGNPYLQQAPDKRALRRAVALSIEALNS